MIKISNWILEQRDKENRKIIERTKVEVVNEFISKGEGEYVYV